MYFLLRIVLCAQFNQQGFWTKVHIVTVCLQIDPAGNPRVILVTCRLHLERQCQIVLQIGIFQLCNRPLPGSAQPVKEHKLCRRAALQIHDETPVLRHLIPMQVDHRLDGRVFP